MHSGRYKCMKTSHGYVNQTNQTRQVFFFNFCGLADPVGEWRGGIMLFGGWQRTKTKGPCRSLIPQRFIFSQMYNFYKQGRIQDLGEGMGAEETTRGLVLSEGNFRLQRPHPPTLHPRRVPEYKGFCIARSCRVRLSS